MRTAVLALVALLGACATYVPPKRIAEYDPQPRARELAHTPFFPQAEYQCGPAALATTLAATGATVTPEDLVPKIWLPQRKGSLQAEIIAATRDYDRVPYVLKPDLSAVLAEIGAGTPVLVLQNLAQGFAEAWHYAVVVGYDSGDDQLVLRSGRQLRALETTRKFDARWQPAQRWALVTMSPDSPPLTATAREWLSAASAFEELGRPAIAARAYAAATRRWPDEPLGWQLLGNARYALRDLQGAEAAFRAALQLKPSAETHNNLAQVLLDLGCPAQAGDQIKLAMDASSVESEKGLFLRTQEQVRAWRGKKSKTCP